MKHALAFSAGALLMFGVWFFMALRGIRGPFQGGDTGSH